MIYEEPKIQIVGDDVEDIIVTSEGGQGGGIVLPPDEEGFE